MKKLIVFLACIFTVGAHAQENVTLRIGDPAPALKYSKWIKGTPVDSFKGDQLYILEFWATWCGPCRDAMPHLTQLQKQYEGKATIIGVGVWEKVKVGQPYDSSLPMVTKFVNGNSANMQYDVIADNNDQFMGNKWLRAAGVSSIPKTFIIKNGQIIWIGSPSDLDSTLGLIMNGSYNMQEFKLRFEKTVSEDQNDPLRVAVKPINAAFQAKEYKKAVELMDKLMVEQPKFKTRMAGVKFKTLLDYISQEEAIAYAEASQNESIITPITILSFVVQSQSNGLAKTTYLWAAKKYENTESKTEINPMILDALATCYARGGDYKTAISKEKKAIKEAKKALKEGKFIGSITDNTVTEYEEALAKYRKARKNKTSKNQK